MALLRILRRLHCIRVTISPKTFYSRRSYCFVGVVEAAKSDGPRPSSRKSVSAWMEDAARMLPVDWRQIVLRQSSQ